jgi:hypothetical protein
MTASIREQILAEIATRLSATAGISQRVYRSRAEAVSRGEMPCLIVEPIADPAEPIGGMCKTDRRLTVKIAILVHADVPDQAADPILVDLHPRLIAPNDQNLGGLAIDVELLGDDFQFAATDGVIITSYRIWYRHDTFALTSA